MKSVGFSLAVKARTRVLNIAGPERLSHAENRRATAPTGRPH